MPLHPCSRKELPLTGETSKFYPIRKDKKKELEDLSEYFMCLDYSNITLRGNYDEETPRALIITISFDEEYCINEDESDTGNECVVERELLDEMWLVVL